MKRLLLLLPLLVGCAEKMDEIVSVTFRVGGGTKSFPSAIVATLPSTVDITIKNKSTQATLTTQTGMEVTLPVGEYSVTGYYNPSKKQNVVGTSVYLSDSPCFYIEQDITINKGKEECVLDATYRSWVLAVDSKESASWTMVMNYEETAVDFLVDGDAWWIFCTGDLSGRFLVTKVFPKSEDGYATATYNLSTSAAYAANNGGNLVEPGKWYWLHPSKASTESASMGIRFPEWSDGTWN